MIIPNLQLPVKPDLDTLHTKLRSIKYPWLLNNHLYILDWIHQVYYIEYSKRFSGMWEARYKDADGKIIWSVLNATTEELIGNICDYVLSKFTLTMYGPIAPRTLLPNKYINTLE